MQQSFVRNAVSLESLESRKMLSSAVLAADGTLTVTGNETADAIEVQIRADKPNKVKVEVNTSEWEFNRTSVKRILVQALGGSDAVEIGKDDEPVAISATIYGGSGNDELDGGASGDLIYGGRGADNIDGEGGNDKLYGEDGNDTIQGSGGNDRILGGAGRDLLQGNAGADTLFGNGGIDTLQGGAGIDQLTQ